MTNITIAVGVILILLGVVGYFGTGMVSITAMIPTFFGLPILILGLLSRNEKLKMHAMHGAVLLALIGFIGSAMRGFPKLFSGNEDAVSTAVIMQLVMAVVCGVFVALSIKSFIDARSEQNAQSL